MTTHTLSLQKISFIKLPRINWKFYMVLGFCLVFMLSILYVLQINGMIAGSYMIKDYQKQINSLITTNKNLEVNLAQISYLENIQKKTEEMNFELVQTIKYIQILDNSLAQR